MTFFDFVCWSSAVPIGPWWRCSDLVTRSSVLTSMFFVSGGRHSARSMVRYRGLKIFAVAASLTSFGRPFHSCITLVLKKLLLNSWRHRFFNRLSVPAVALCLSSHSLSQRFVLLSPSSPFYRSGPCPSLGASRWGLGAVALTRALHMSGSLALIPPSLHAFGPSLEFQCPPRSRGPRLSRRTLGVVWHIAYIDSGKPSWQLDSAHQVHIFRVVLANVHDMAFGNVELHPPFLCPGFQPG